MCEPRIMNKPQKKSGASRQCQPLLICLEFFIYVVKLFNTLLSLERLCYEDCISTRHSYRSYSNHNTGYCYVLLPLTAVAASAIITYIIILYACKYTLDLYDTARQFIFVYRHAVNKTSTMVVTMKNS